MNELFRTFNPHEETTRAAREWNQGPSYEDIFRPQIDRRGITNANVDDRPLFQNAALGAAPYDNQHQLTSIENLTNSPRFRDFVTGVARNRGTAQDLSDIENLPWGEMGYKQFAGKNVPPEVLGYLRPFDEGGFNPELIGELYEPWTGSGFVPRFTGPETWGDEDFTIGADLNLPVLGGEALIDYNVRPSENIRDMTHPLQGDADWDATIRYQKKIRDWFGRGDKRSVIDDLTIPPEWE